MQFAARTTRGPAQYRFTLTDLAHALNLPEEQVRAAKRRGEFDPRNLRTVVVWMLKRVIPKLVDS